MTPVRFAPRFVAVAAITVAATVLVAVVSLGAAAPAATHPLFYFALIFLGGGATALLFAGVGAASSSRTAPTAQADIHRFGRIRRLALAMWLCVVVTDTLGVLLLLAIADVRASTPLSTSTLGIAFAAAAVTVIGAGITSVMLRRALPTR